MSDTNLARQLDLAYYNQSRVKRTERFAAGQCVVLSCPHPRANGVRCLEHVRLSAQQAKRRYQTPEGRTKRCAERVLQTQRRKGKSLCVRCGQHPHKPGGSLCCSCSKRKTKRGLARRVTKRERLLASLAAQNPTRFNREACAICGKPPHPKKGLALDHCHQSGALRGLLCDNCNLGIGCFGDSAELLTKAIHYLRLPTS